MTPKAIQQIEATLQSDSFKEYQNNKQFLSNQEETIPWSEFHYHFFSWLIDKDTPRELAMGIELQIFSNSHTPNKQLLHIYVSEIKVSEDPSDWMLTALEIYNANRLLNQKAL